MIIRNNPFTSKLYKNKWNIHFHGGKPSYGFKFIKGIEFTKNKYFPLYYNVGKYKSCGMSYNLSTSKKTCDFKNKVFLIYDVPEYFELNSSSTKLDGLGIKKVAQYEGYLIELSKFEHLESYFKSKFNSKRRRTILKRKNQLEKSFDISYEMYYGEINRETFDYLLKKLYDLIENKFQKKKKKNAHTLPGIRKWYDDLIFDMINKKNASFFVIKNKTEPIAINLNYHSENILFAAVPATDTSFSKYGIGSIQNLKKIEWALSNGYSHYDLSKGSYGYKQRWATKEYNFEYHILYDKKSFTSCALAFFLVNFYQLKQFARESLPKINKLRQSLSLRKNSSK